jgi:ABC-type oligopeptide transport system substrate-binding subunit
LNPPLCNKHNKEDIFVRLKKILTALLALTLVLSAFAPASFAETGGVFYVDEEDVTTTNPDTGTGTGAGA